MIAALTWLDPHVWLDTVVLLGAVSAQRSDPTAFGLGAVAASFAFFFSPGYGARLLAPLLARPAPGRRWSLLFGVVMLAIAAALIVQ